MTVRTLAWSFGGMVLAPAVDALGLRSITLLVANRDTDVRVMPQLHPLAQFAREAHILESRKSPEFSDLMDSLY